MCSWCLSDFLLMVSVEPDPDDVFPLRRRSEGQPPARLGGVRKQAEPGSSGAVLRLGLLRSFCQYSPRPCRRHMSLFLAPVSWVEWRSERSLEVDSEPLTGVGTKCGPGVPGPPVLRSRKPWQDPLDGWGFWEPGMQKTLHSDKMVARAAGSATNSIAPMASVWGWVTSPTFDPPELGLSSSRGFRRVFKLGDFSVWCKVFDLRPAVSVSGR